MAVFHGKILFFLPLTLYFLSCFPSICSLSTVAISETSNQTLICALVHSSPQLSRLNCTSFPGGIQIPINSNESFSGIVAGNGFLCVLRSFFSSSTAAMRCWRLSNNTRPHKRIYRGPLLKELEAGNSHICGLVNGTNKLECWQWPGFNSRKSNHNFSSLAVGEDFVCGLSSEFGDVKCLQKQNSCTVVGNFSLVESGFHRACAISLNGSLQCWREDCSSESPPQGEFIPPQGEFTSLALGENRSCAIRTNRTVTCWGRNNFSLPEALRTTEFISVEAKRRIFCGVLYANYSLLCWGNQILDSNPMVFENVVPGPCKSACPCSPLPNYADFCSHGLKICLPCAGPSLPGEIPPQPPPPPPLPPPTRRSNNWNKKTVAFLVVGSVGSLSTVMVCIFLFFRYCKIRGCRVHDSGRLDEEGTPHSQPPPPPPPAATTATPVLEKRLSQLLSIGNGGRLEEFSLEILHQSTDNFSEHHKIGKGSFGSVYRATLDDGREVAIKRAEASSSASQVIGKLWTKRQEDDKDTAFLNELESLSRLNHKNLVRLLGYCEDSNERILVYEYMNNGTLHDHLHNLKSSPLMSWVGRIKVALDAAKGIQYLHEYAVPPIIHRDIKSSNILLDSNWTAKVSDFGLSLMGPSDDESSLSLGAAGTVGYMDPEYYRFQQLSSKSDVYSFGVLLLELLSGLRAIHQNENGLPRNVVDLVVPHIARDQIHRVLDKNVAPPTPFEIEAVAYVGYIAADCVALEGRDRPTMTEIVNRLDRALAACVAAPPFQTGSSEENSVIL